MTRPIPTLFVACAALAACNQETKRPEATPELVLAGRIVDEAEVFSPEFEAEMTQKLADLEAEAQVQIVVVSTPDLKGIPISEYSLKLFNNWGVGHAERNDGVGVLIAPNEREARIEVGLGLEAIVTDEEAQGIMNEAIIPHFEKGAYEVGVEEGVDRLILEVTSIAPRKAA